MAQDPRREFLENLSKRNANQSAQVYEPESLADASQDTLKFDMGDAPELPKVMNPMADPAADSLRLAIDDDDFEDPDDIDMDISLEPDEEPPMPHKPRPIYKTSSDLEDTDFPAYRTSRSEDIDELSEELANTEDDKRSAVIKVIGGVAIAVLIIAFIFVGVKGGIDKVKNKDKDQPNTSTTSQGASGPATPPGVLTLKNESISFDTDLYKDTLEITKIIELRNGTACCFFRGTPEHFPQLIYIPVTGDQYNSYDNGEFIDINYNIITFQGTAYVVNPTIKEIT